MVALVPPNVVKRNYDQPRSTRHRGVLQLLDAVDVYDMRDASNCSVLDIINESMNATPQMKTKTISTSRLKKRNDGSGLTDMDVTIHAFFTSTVTRMNDEENDDRNISVVVTMPEAWTPMLYLAMVNSSIRKWNILSLETSTICSGIERYYSFNSVHCNYNCFNLQYLQNNLLNTGAFADVVGGNTIQ